MMEVRALRSDSGIKIVHAGSGRIRLRASGNGSPKAIEFLAQQLRQQEGVREVMENPKTGSWLVTFAPEKLSQSPCLQLLQQWSALGVGTSPPIERSRQRQSRFRPTIAKTRRARSPHYRTAMESDHRVSHLTDNPNCISAEDARSALETLIQIELNRSRTGW